MTQHHAMLFRYDEEIRRGLEAIKERDGIPFQVQLRLAMLAWMDVKGVGPVTEPVSARMARLAARLNAIVNETQQVTHAEQET